jgi:hypothetical protein
LCAADARTDRTLLAAAAVYSAEYLADPAVVFFWLSLSNGAKRARKPTTSLKDVQEGQEHRFEKYVS